MSLRSVLPLLCLAASAAALVGCGGDTLSFDPVASAATKTATSQSARVAFTATMNIDGVGGMAFSGSGVFDGRSHSGALNMRFQLPADAQAQLGAAEPTMQMIMDGRSGLVMYMRSPLFARVAGDRWIKVDLAKLANKQGVDLNALMNANQADPSQTLGMLKASADAHPIGYDHIRGVFTTHYKLDIDLARLAKQNTSLRKMVDTIRQVTGTTSYPAEAWIDDAGRVRRMKIDMSFNSPAAGALTMSMTEDLYAFGTKVDVHAPAASKVLDVSQAG
ncbi:MAG TPA: hypothetical protein VKB64_05980 [Gaiellaceae bacterium]|nr:hypothetical protein [Gaiellaceae bacterium]